MSLPFNLQTLLAQSGPKATPLNQVIPSVSSAPAKSAPPSAGRAIEPTADLITINDRDVNASARAVTADITKYNAAFKFRTGRSIACSRLYTAYTVRDGKVRVVSNDLSGNGRLLIEDLTGCDFADMCWASASALVVSATDGRIAVFIMQQELGQLSHRMVCQWKAAGGEHYASITFASAASDHNMPAVIYAGTAAGIINALTLYAPYSVIGLVNAGSCVNQIEFSPASASAGPCLFAATAANGVIKVELTPSLLDRASNPVSFNPLQSVPSLSAEAAVHCISVIGAGHLLVSVAHNHVVALIDTSTLSVLQCLRVNSSESQAAVSSSSKPNVLFCNPFTADGCGYVFVSRFESTELLCFRINRQKPVPVIDWVSKQDIEYPVMCLQSAPSSISDRHLRLVLYQTSFIRIFTIDTVSSIASSSSSPSAAAETTEPLCAAAEPGDTGKEPLVDNASSDDGAAAAAVASAAPLVETAAVSVPVASAQPPSAAPHAKPKVVQNVDVFRSAFQVSSSDRTDSSSAATSNVASMLSDVLCSSTTPGDYTGSSDFSPKVEDAFAALVSSSAPAVAVQQPAPPSHSPAPVSVPAASSSAVAASPASAFSAPQPSSVQNTLKMLASAQPSGKVADSKKDKEQPVAQPPKTKAPEVKVTEIKTAPPLAAKAAAPVSMSDLSRDELDKMLQSRFEVQSSRMERELRALSESLARKQTEHEAHVVKSVKEVIANQVNAAVSKAVSESMKPLQKSIDTLVKSSSQSPDTAEALRVAAAGIVRSVGADFDSRMRAHTESLIARLDSMLKQPAPAPAPVAAASSEPSAEVVAFIKAGQYDNALGVTLNENNLELLVKVLAMLEADKVVPTLSQPVVLALIDCLAFGLHVQQEAKLTWMLQAVLKLDAADPSISSHAQPVLRRLVAKISSTPLLSSTPNFADLEAKRKKISGMATGMF